MTVGTSVYGCILVENEVLAIEMMKGYIQSNSKLRLLGVATTLPELQQLHVRVKPDLIFLDLIVPSAGCDGFDYSMLSDNATIVVMSGIPLSRYAKRYLLKNPIELPKPVSYAAFCACMDNVVKDWEDSPCKK